jgi:hypothetical protein
VTVETPAIERKIRWASFLIGAGLLVQFGSFLVVHPLAFVAFVMVGCPLMAAGIVLYLLSLISNNAPQGDAPSRVNDKIGHEPRQGSAQGIEI